MFKTFRTAVVIASVSIAPIVLSSAAWADTARLDFKGLDLSTEAGKAEMERRIEVAARQACPEVTITGSHIPQEQQRAACMADVRHQIAAHLAGKGSVASSR